MIYHKFLIVLFICCNCLLDSNSWGMGTSMADGHSGFSANEFVGQVTNLGHSTEGIRVRLKNLSSGRGQRFETVYLCHIHEGDTLTAQAKMELDNLREAMNKKSMVRVSYDTSFSRCLNQVDFFSNDVDL